MGSLQVHCSLQWPLPGHRIPQSTVCVAHRLKYPLFEGIQGNSRRPFSYQVANPHGHCRRPCRAGIHIVSSCGKLLGSLSDGHCDEVSGERPPLRTNNCGTEAHCSTFPQRSWVYFTLTEKLSGTVSFRISTRP